MTADPMTIDELRRLLDEMGWSQGDLAYFAQRDNSRVRKMARNGPIDPEMAGWLRDVHRLFTNPPKRGRGDAGPGDHLPGAGRTAARRTQSADA